jgi:hypothetical protein
LRDVLLDRLAIGTLAVAVVELLGIERLEHTGEILDVSEGVAALIVVDELGPRHEELVGHEVNVLLGKISSASTESEIQDERARDGHRFSYPSPRPSHAKVDASDQ